MTAQQLLADAAEAIAAIGAGNPRLEAELLLAHALGRTRVYLMTHPEYEPSSGELARFHAMLGRRRSSEPLQYVLGDAAFRHLTLRVRPGVLIPRAETEILVDHAWTALQRWRARQAAGARGGEVGQGGEVGRGVEVARGGEVGRRDEVPGREITRRREIAPDGEDARPWVIDVGVGAGAIVLAIMYEALAAERGTMSSAGRVAGAGGASLAMSAGRAARQNGTASANAVAAGLSELWFRPLGIDISAIPLSVTSENAALNALPRPYLALGDFLGAIRADVPVAGIISNPPYIATGEMAELPAEIREYEPHEALHAGPDGLGAIRILLDQARPFVDRGAFLCFEIGGLQADGVRRELASRGLLELARIHPDLAGRPRVVLLEPGAPARGEATR